jgi:hypothetical protein
MRSRGAEQGNRGAMHLIEGGGGDVAAVDADAELTPGADLRLTLPVVSLSQQAR